MTLLELKEQVDRAVADSHLPENTQVSVSFAYGKGFADRRDLDLELSSETLTFTIHV